MINWGAFHYHGQIDSWLGLFHSQECHKKAHFQANPAHFFSQKLINNAQMDVLSNHFFMSELHLKNLWLICWMRKSALFDFKQLNCNLPILRPILMQRCFAGFLVKTRSNSLNYPKCSWLCRFCFWFNFPPKLITIQQCVETIVEKNEWFYSLFEVYNWYTYICVCMHVMVSVFGFKTEHNKKNNFFLWYDSLSASIQTILTKFTGLVHNQIDWKQNSNWLFYN